MDFKINSSPQNPAIIKAIYSQKEGLQETPVCCRAHNTTLYRRYMSQTAGLCPQRIWSGTFLPHRGAHHHVMCHPLMTACLRSTQLRLNNTFYSMAVEPVSRFGILCQVMSGARQVKAVFQVRDSTWRYQAERLARLGVETASLLWRDLHINSVSQFS